MPGRAPLVLLLDDDLPWLRALRRLLTREGATVLAFTEAGQLLAAMDATPASLVVLDYVLPTTNGAQVAREIRTRPDPPPLALLSSSLGLLTDEERTLFDAVIDKHEESSSVIEQLLQLTRPLVKGRTGTRMRAIQQQTPRRGRARH